MMLRLVVRMLRGGGAPGLARIVLVTVGIALGVIASALVAVLPGVLQARADVMNDRDPAPAAATVDPSFFFSTSIDVWNGQRLGRTFLADVRPGAPTAPGVNRLPEPGEVIASPALAKQLRDHSDLAHLVPGNVVGEVTADGLIDPDELFAYIGLPVDRMADAHAASSFGSYDSLRLAKQQSGLTQSLALLVLPPVLAYLLVCSRLAAATRTRRYAALRLLGVRKGTVLRIAFFESTLLGSIGAALGLALFRLVHQPLADSHALGFSWYADRAQFGITLTVVLLALVGLTSGIVGSAGLRRTLNRPLIARADPAEPKSRFWLLLPMIAGAGAVCYLLVVLPRRVAPDVRLGMTGFQANFAIGAAAVMMLGLLLGLRPILVTLARLMRHSALPLPVRIAAERLALQPATTLRLLTGLALLVLVAGVSSGVLKDMELRSSPAADNYSVDIQATDKMTAVAQQQIHDLPAHFTWTVQSSVVDLESPPSNTGRPGLDQARAAGYRVITLTCATMRDIVRQPLQECQEGGIYRLTPRQLVGTPYEVPGGSKFTFDQADGKETTVSVPERRVVIPDDTLFPVQAVGALYIAQDGPAYGWTKDTMSSFLIDADPQVLSAFKSHVAFISPTTTVLVWGEDLDLLELTRNQRGVIDFGVLCGFVIALLAFGIAVIDNAVERRRDVAVLMVVGMRRRTIRTMQITQLLVALGTILVTAAGIGYLAGNLAFRLNDVNRAWFAGPLESMLPFTATAVLVALGAGSFVAIRRLRADDLKRE